MKGIKERLNKFMLTHCLFFWHSFHWVSDTVPGIIGNEAFYWTLEQCSKCKQHQAVLGRNYE